MLTLTRKLYESVIVGEGEGRVVVTVVYLGGDRVRLAFDAPRDVPINRMERATAAQLCEPHEPDLGGES